MRFLGEAAIALLLVRKVADLGSKPHKHFSMCNDAYAGWRFVFCSDIFSLPYHYNNFIFVFIIG